MATDNKYSISTELKFRPLEVINIPELVKSCQENWKNITLSRINDCLVRLGIIQGEFHWHKHECEDEFFYVIDGLLYIDLPDHTVHLSPKHGFTVPKKVLHRTRAPERTTILMIEGSSIKPTGD